MNKKEEQENYNNNNYYSNSYNYISILKNILLQLLFILIIYLISFYYNFTKYLTIIFILNIVVIIQPVFIHQFFLVSNFIKNISKRQNQILKEEEDNNDNDEDDHYDYDHEEEKLKCKNYLKEKTDKIDKKQFYTKNNVYEDSYIKLKDIKKNTNNKKKLKRDVNLIIKEKNKTKLLENFKNFCIKKIIKPLIKNDVQFFNFNPKISNETFFYYLNEPFVLNPDYNYILDSLSKIGWIFYDKESSEHRRDVHVLLSTFVNLVSNYDIKYSNYIFFEKSTNEANLRVDNVVYDCQGDPFKAYFYLFLYVKEELGGFMNDFNIKRIFNYR